MKCGAILVDAIERTLKLCLTLILSSYHMEMELDKRTYEHDDLQ